MTSKAKKTKASRKRKAKPNRANLKTDMKRIQKNTEILKELSGEESLISP